MSPYTANSLKAELNSRGWRLTPQREKILHVFQNLPRGNHLSAEELYNLLEKRDEGISLSTIYRSVKLMSRMGILRELELAEGHKHYGDEIKWVDRYTLCEAIDKGEFKLHRLNV